MPVRGGQSRRPEAETMRAGGSGGRSWRLEAEPMPMRWGHLTQRVPHTWCGRAV